MQGYDVILGLDWLAKLGPKKIDWGSKWIEFEKGGKAVKLQVQEESAKITMCQALELSKELK